MGVGVWSPGGTSTVPGLPQPLAPAWGREVEAPGLEHRAGRGQNKAGCVPSEATARGAGERRLCPLRGGAAFTGHPTKMGAPGQGPLQGHGWPRWPLPHIPQPRQGSIPTQAPVTTKSAKPHPGQPAGLQPPSHSRKDGTTALHAPDPFNTHTRQLCRCPACGNTHPQGFAPWQQQGPG